MIFARWVLTSGVSEKSGTHPNFYPLIFGNHGFAMLHFEGSGALLKTISIPKPLPTFHLDGHTESLLLPEPLADVSFWKLCRHSQAFPTSNSCPRFLLKILAPTPNLCACLVLKALAPFWTPYPPETLAHLSFSRAYRHPTPSNSKHIYFQTGSVVQSPKSFFPFTGSEEVCMHAVH